MVVEDTNEIDAVVDRIRRIMLREETLIHLRLTARGRASIPG
jgi:hypothetical protein